MSPRPSILHSPERYKQLHSFEHLRWGTISPTDLDGLVDFHDHAFAFLEIKMQGQEIPFGQNLALTRVINHLERAGRKAALFFAEHCVRDLDQQIDVSQCRTQKVYTRGVWTWLPGNPILRTAMDDFFAGRAFPTLASVGPLASDEECAEFYRWQREKKTTR